MVSPEQVWPMHDHVFQSTEIFSHLCLETKKKMAGLLLTETRAITRSVTTLWSEMFALRFIVYLPGVIHAD